MCKQECLRSERKVLSPDFKESEEAESFERNCQVCIQAISFTDMWTKENKTVNHLWKETL